MPRGTELSNEEQIKIKTMADCGVKVGVIATTINRHRNTISNFLKSPQKHAQNNRKGAVPKVDERTKLHVRALATEKMMSCAQIKAELKLPITRQRCNKFAERIYIFDTKLRCQNLSYYDAIKWPDLLFTKNINFGSMNSIMSSLAMRRNSI